MGSGLLLSRTLVSMSALVRSNRAFVTCSSNETRRDDRCQDIMSLHVRCERQILHDPQNTLASEYS